MLSLRIALSVLALALVSACGGGGGGGGTAANNTAIFGLTVDNAATPTKLVVC